MTFAESCGHWRFLLLAYRSFLQFTVSLCSFVRIWLCVAYDPHYFFLTQLRKLKYTTRSKDWLHLSDFARPCYLS